MTTRALLDGQLIDLTTAGPDVKRIIISLHQQPVDTRVIRLECAEVGGGALVVKRSSCGNYFLSHLPGEHTDHVHNGSIDESDTDEFKVQTEYHVRAAEDAGLTAETRVSTGPGGHFVDLMVTGATRTAFDIRRPSVTLETAQRRANAATRAGITPVRFNGSANKSASWTYRVPSSLCNNIGDWSSMPAPRGATAVGPRHIQAQACTIDNYPHQCPVTGSGWCGTRTFHPHAVLWEGLTVDDVVAMVPTKRLVPLKFNKNLVYLVGEEDQRRFAEITGDAGVYAPGAVRETDREQQEHRCENSSHAEEFSLFSTEELIPAVAGGQHAHFRNRDA